MRSFSHLFAAVMSSYLFAACGAAPEAFRTAARQAPAKQEAAQPAADAAPRAGEAAVQVPERKIVYVAELKLVTPEFSQIETAIPDLVKKHRGYLADANVDRTSGQRRTGRWVARVPVEEFDALMNEAAELGVPESRRQNAEDVTEQYVDLEARIANSKGLEARIVKLLEVRAGELKDVIEVERELARVRGDIEQMEGRLRYLANRAAMATVTILVREEKDYKPPQAPTYLARLSEGWSSSLASLLSLGQDLTIAAAAATPWLLTMGVVVAPVGLFLRRRKRAPG
jgi:uncharacterized coiled-coil protein SlyX